MAKLMDVSDSDVALIEDVIAERLAVGVSQPVAQRQAIDEALAQLAEERSMVMKAIEEQLFPQKEAKPEVSVEREAPAPEEDAAPVEPVMSNKSAIGFYSALAEGINTIPTKSSTAQGWKDAIKGMINKGQVKADEVEWTGLNDWLDLQQGKVSKEAVAEYLNANGVQVEEVTLGRKRGQDFQTHASNESAYVDGARSVIEYIPENALGLWASRVAEEMGMDEERLLSEALRVRAGEDVSSATGEDWYNDSKYSNYTLPGGENYREVLLTLPDGRKAAPEQAERMKVVKREDGNWDVMDGEGVVKSFRDWGEANGYAYDQQQAENIKRNLEWQRNQPKVYQSSHWDAPNVLAHIRVNDRTDADGKRVLFVEEIQSDWGQDGKKKGFAKKEWWVQLSNGDKEYYANEQEANRVARENNTVASPVTYTAGKVPAAPFVNKTEGWLNLALKRVITMAAEGGYDRVAFVNGEQSADRYDLSKQVSEIKYRVSGDDNYRIEVMGRNGIIPVPPSLDADGLEAHVGKEIAQKIVSTATKENQMLRGLDLKVGGEGMKAFYDKIVPAAVNTMLKKLGGGKLTGVDVGRLKGDGESRYSMGAIDPTTATIVERAPGVFQVWAPNATSGVKQVRGGNFDTREQAEQYIRDMAPGQTQPGFDITDAMREKAEAGMPLFANKPRPAPLAEETPFQAFRRVIQDKYLQVQRVQDAILDAGGTVGEQQDVYRAEERMHGRAQEKLIDFGRNLLEPMLKKAAKFGIELDELAAYAYAKHAQERNDHIDHINPALQGAGSGMDTATAQNIMQMVQLSGDQAKFDELHQDLMRLTEATRQEYLKSGLISQDEYDGWTGMYQNYVPLKGFENVDPEGNARPGVGSGLSIKGKETIKALGRRSRAGDIIENIVADHERAVLRGERNQVAKTFLNLVQTNPDPNLWEVQPRKQTRSFDKKRNLVVYHQAPDTADSIGAKVAGQQVYIKVKDPLLLRAMTNEGLDKKGALHGTVVRLLGIYTNLLRNTLTRYNPVFGAVNAVRDAPMGALSTYDTLGGKGVALYAKYYAQAAAAAGRQEWGSPNMAKEMDRWLKEMRLAGGTTSGVFMRDVSEIKDDLRTLMLLSGAQPNTLREKLLVKTKPAVKGAQAVGKVLEWVGSTSEDAARLAAYRAARELGKTPAQAASIAKNLTTNFNRSGEWGSSINGLYLFFNAGVQGTTRLAQALTNPRVRYVLAAGVAGAAALALANAAGGGEDDDGVPYWDQIPDYEKERNLIIMLPPGMEMDGAATVGKKGRYIKIPIQYGLNIFMSMGYQMADLARNMKDPTRGVSPGKAAINMASAVFGSINPFGGSFDPTSPTQVGMQLLPTAGDTALQLMAGVNAFGKPVGPEKGAYDTKPDSETYSAAQAGTASQRLAHWMNSVTGGNEGRSGMIDVMPGTLDNAVRNTTGGLGMFASALVNLPLKAWDAPETIAPRDVPYWRNFYGELDSVSAVGKFYENRAQAMDELKNFEREQKLGIKRQYTPEEVALQTMGATAEGYTKAMSAIRKEEIEVALDEKKSDREKLLARKRLALERASLAKDYNSVFVKEMEAAERAKE